MDTKVLSDAVSLYMSSNPWIILLLLWSLVWKLMALWNAAKRNHLTIFIVLGVVNTAGIAEIIYLAYLYFKEKNLEQSK